ncbi:MAG: N(4)-(beta-N-acetylglucosaminyl)-L-asparaginase [Ignavibacteriae bacterium]|nr:N(4)-(beta-N-acetylglucosaminyl)-L-asparaginase [Ignavibacteriota bacterium]
MQSRRQFIKISALTGALLPFLKVKGFGKSVSGRKGAKPIVLSTWHFGVPANEEAWKVLNSGGWALDAVEAGVRIPEGDPKVMSVGYGGLPDRDGHVTLDACIMDENLNCGSVAFLENIMHPISVARLVMEKTPHIMIVGEGAYQFAIQQGFKKENLLTPEAEKVWKEWMKNSGYKPKIDDANHDTIGMIALDSGGRLCGACTTSGLSWKIHGRVGDSPIIGAGLYVDGEVGAATSTGIGEEVIRISGTHLVVELMRQGRTPQEACEEAVNRVVKNKRNKIDSDFQVGFLALNKDGEYGAYAVNKGFQYAVYSKEENNILKDSKSHI